MLDFIKSEFIKNPDKIITYMEHFGYEHIKNHGSYISCARDLDSSPKSIVIRLTKNEALLVHDYARDVVLDIFNFIIKQRGIGFGEVINYSKNILGIDNGFYGSEKKQIFGGLFNNIKKQDTFKVEVFDESVLNKYRKGPNKKFLKDNISISAQKEFGIGFDVMNQAITIPIRDEFGRLMGVKERINHTPREGEQKYYYDIPCLMTHTLYGYCNNYNYLCGNTIYVFEAEKSVMAAWSFGYKNCVALGSSNLSKKQCQLLISAEPKEVVFLYDEGSKPEIIKKSAETLLKYSRMKDFKIMYWDFKNSIYCEEGSKVSPTDLGKEAFEYIINDELLDIQEGGIL